ncbi:nitrous oxide-stimulated promoter family protein [Dysgonomonas sp. Marseille-P4677]|uniref:nitrous oxide-stimulated promoter family protein n=1 Tax=Dysgonomonas sp. Marseille-P4677 TaxID=2364790 RepID=UPI001913E0FB|nr:nitrous oxide-stimulated promoter family protein [Dysgonomonas sp. Marseille-P4677]MBK5722843.1 nitrous oxide-stimulated promoter family protein [Dysgonomonas sp. Marseille-P4677]
MNNTEKKTVEKMIQIYCAAKHNTSGNLCSDCYNLNLYARKRLEKCKFGEDKPNCQDCPIHCYQPEMKIKIQEVMRYSGPRILFKHPLLALNHMIKGFRRK